METAIKEKHPKRRAITDNAEVINRWALATSQQKRPAEGQRTVKADAVKADAEMGWGGPITQALEQ